MCIPNEVIADALQRYSVKTLSISYERNPVDGIATNTRVMMIDANDWDAIPDTLVWSFDGFRGTSLLFLAGRPPRCHRCQQRGHKVADCMTPYCRVAEFVEGPATNLRMNVTAIIHPTPVVSLLPLVLRRPRRRCPRSLPWRRRRWQGHQRR